MTSRQTGINNENDLNAKPDIVIPMPARILENRPPPISLAIADTSITSTPLSRAGIRRTANNENDLRAKPEMVIPIPARILEYILPPISFAISDTSNMRTPLSKAGIKRAENNENPNVFSISKAIQPIIGGTVAKPKSGCSPNEK